MHDPGANLASQVASQVASHGEIDRSVQLSCGEHSDYGMLTLVNQEDDVTALQVCMLNSSGPACHIFWKLLLSVQSSRRKLVEF